MRPPLDLMESGKFFEELKNHCWMEGIAVLFNSTHSIQPRVTQQCSVFVYIFEFHLRF